ncbi:MAG TPA: hypothetical protein QGH10_18655, partial [Armatimonadota bacterium]|nr:hypothetical protein [Armatimonadota bacterium]
MSNGPRGMVCREAVRHMHKVLDARETAGARDGLTAHLAVCEACRTQYERLASVPGALLLDGAPELTSAAWQRVSAGMQTQLTHTRRLRPAHLLRAGVLIVLCLGVALVFLTPERESVSALAGVLDAMDEVETAHGKGIHTVAYWAEGDGLREREEPLETWFASGRGLRRETPTWVVLREPDATVRYNKTQAAAAIETGSDTYGDSFMGRVLSTLYLSPDPRQPKRHVTEGKADLHGRAVDYVEISRDSFGRQWSRWWVDPKSKLILRIEAGDEPDPKPTYRMDYDYN